MITELFFLQRFIFFLLIGRLMFKVKVGRQNVFFFCTLFIEHFFIYVFVF